VCSEIKGHKVFLLKHDGLKHTIYESRSEEEKHKKDTPQIIDEINQYLKEPMPENVEIPTVENIAQRVGINRKTLYKSVKMILSFLQRLRG
jgi:AraC-like DNA-binding protein